MRMLYILEKQEATAIPCIINDDCTYTILIVFPFFPFFHAFFLTLVYVIIKMCEMSLLITLVMSVMYPRSIMLFYANYGT